MLCVGEGRPYWSTHFQHANHMAAVGRAWKVDSCLKKKTFYGPRPTRFHSWFLLNSRNRFTPKTRQKYGSDGKSQGSMGFTKRCRLSWLTNSSLVHEPKCGGRGRVLGSQPMSTAVHRSPNKLWRSNSIFNLWKKLQTAPTWAPEWGGVYWQRDLGKMAKIGDSSFTRGRVRPSQEEGTSFTRGGCVLHKRRVRPLQE